jgi:hypothetical protein
VVGRIAVTLALLAASLAWAGWVFLRTVGDPARTEKIARAILDDDAARGQLAAALTGQLVDLGPIRAPDERLLDDALSEVLADPRVSDNLITALSASHAATLGVDDPRSTTIDTSLLVDGLREKIAPVAPELVELLPSAELTATQLPDITLPRYTPPGAGSLRNTAEAATLPLAIVAFALAAIGVALGERRIAIRRIGVWGIANGLFWAAVPILAPALAVAIKPEVSDLVDVTMRATSGSVRPAAIGLVVVGVVLVVLSVVPQLWPSPYPDTYVVRRPDSAVLQRSAAHPASPENPARPARGGASPATAGAPAAARPVDTFEPSSTAAFAAAGAGAAVGAATASPSYTINVAPATGPIVAPGIADGSVVAPPIAEPAPTDPWAAYFPPSPPERP